MKYFETAVQSEMSLNDLKHLVNTGEGSYLEFKRTVPSPEKIAREIAAFANTRGGTLLIGVDDDKTLVGVTDYFEEEYLLRKAAEKLCKPAADIHIEIVPFSLDRDIMVVRVMKAEVKPVYVYQDMTNRTVYTRVDDKSVVASDEQVNVLKNETSSEGVSFEYGPNEQKLFRYLNEYGRITVNEFSNLIDVTSYRASNILVSLVSAGVLELFNTGKNEYFSFSNECA
ncbi:MAG: AlbA family DNA-binding domain-containing protein [Bacteroidota bacterium]